MDQLQKQFHHTDKVLKDFDQSDSEDSIGLDDDMFFIKEFSPSRLLEDRNKNQP